LWIEQAGKEARAPQWIEQAGKGAAEIGRVAIL